MRHHESVGKVDPASVLHDISDGDERNASRRFWRRQMVAVCNVSCQVQKSHQLTCSPCFREDRLEMTFEQGTGVLKVLFGVGFGGGDAVKRFVENANDPLLFE